MKEKLEQLEKLVCQADNACTKIEFEKIQPLIQEMYDLIQEMK